MTPGNMVVTVTIDDSLRQKAIGVLERAKHDHYSEPEGLDSCPATSGRGMGPRDTDAPCECGADEINAEIDALIAELKVSGTQRAVRDAVTQDRFGNQML